jgi:hypothetical protein
LCGARILELGRLESQKDHLMELRNSVNEFMQEIKIHSILCPKPKEKIFSKDNNLEQLIEKISRRSNVQKTLIKRNFNNGIEEIKIFINQEKSIYEFIEGLLFDLPGITQFKSIRIFSTDNKSLVAIIQPKFFTFQGETSLIFIDPPARNCTVKSIDLFGMNKAKLHKLFCTIGNSKAYIDDSWVQVGDGMDGYRIMNINQNSIGIQGEDGETTIVKLGESW